MASGWTAFPSQGPKMKYKFAEISAVDHYQKLLFAGGLYYNIKIERPRNLYLFYHRTGLEIN